MTSFPAFPIKSMAVAMTVFIAGCATSTPYAPALESKYGFKEQKIENNRWSVTFSGNALTERETVENYLLYRAAELTSSEGYDFFRVVRRETDESTNYRSSDPFNSGFGFTHSYFSPRLGWRHRHDPFLDEIHLREVTRYEASAEIILARGTKPSDDKDAYSANSVLENLSGVIVRPTP